MRTQITPVTTEHLAPLDRNQFANVLTTLIARTGCVFQHPHQLLFQPLTLIVAICLGVIPVVNAGTPGSLDLAFNPTPGITSSSIAEINVVLPQPDGRVVIGGEFTAVNGFARNNIACLMPDGSLDTNFVTSITRAGGFAAINALVLQGDRILVGGRFDSVNGLARYGLVRLQSNGTLDNSFLAQLTFFPEIQIIVLQPDGKILITGSFSSVNGVNRFNFARLNADGSLDLSFDAGQGVGGFPYALAVQPDGKILVGGFFSGPSGNGPINLARLNANGTLDSSYQPSLSTFGIVNSLAVQPDGKALLAGDFEQINGFTRYGYARMNLDGTLDTAFALGDTSTNQFSIGGRLDAVLIQPDGKICFAGDWTSLGGFYGTGVGRFLANGTADPAFISPHFGGTLSSVRLQNDGKLIVAGWFQNVGGISRNSVARLYGDSVSAPQLLSLTRHASGYMQLDVAKPAGYCCVIEAATNLALPQWQAVATNCSTTNRFQWLDTNSSSINRRFYRAAVAQ